MKKTEYQNDERKTNKIYTRSGDNGTAGLFSGERVLKSHERIESFGDVDELNSSLGVLMAVLPDDTGELPLMAQLIQIQSDLFHVGAWLATSRESEALSKLEEIGTDRIVFLETAIDQMEERLPHLNKFILPNGRMAGAWAHFARTICRRAERHVVRLSIEAPLGKKPRKLKGVLAYLNRLSDYLFVLARYCNYCINESDRLWEK